TQSTAATARNGRGPTFSSAATTSAAEAATTDTANAICTAACTAPIVGQARSYPVRVGLEEDVWHAAEAATAHAVDEERVGAVLAAEPSPGRRFYLCAYSGSTET